MANKLIDDLDNLSVSDSKACKIEDCKNLLPHYDKCLTIITQNIRSIYKNFDELKILLYTIAINCDIIVLSECWLSKRSGGLPTLDGYKSICSENILNQNDGLVVYIKNNLNVVIEKPNIHECNCLLIKITNDTAILSIYRPPSLNVDNFLKSLDLALHDLATYKNIIITGDININIASGRNDSRVHDYLNICSFHGLLPAHTFPTHQSGSCLDHFIIKTSRPSCTLVTNSSITDHHAVLLKLNLSLRKNNCIQSYTKLNIENLTIDIPNIDLAPIYSCADPNISLTYLINALQHVIHKNTSIIRLSSKHKITKPWITQGLLRCIRHRDKLHLKAKKEPDNEIISVTYKRYRNYCNKLLKKLKLEYNKAELEKAGKNSKLVWKFIKNCTFTTKNNEPAMDLLQSQLYPNLVLNNINTFFANVGKTLAGKIAPQQTLSSYKNTIPSLNSRLKSFVLLDTDVNEVVQVITGLKDTSSVGWDNIPTSIIKRFKHFLAPPLTHIFQICLTEGIFPKCLKKAIVIPVHKAGDKSCVNNYRPISILPALSKILEKIINNRLVKYLESNNILSDKQFGFRPQKSTSQAVHLLTDQIVANLDNGMHAIGIFLDLAKAFDSVSISILLKKLEYVGIRGTQLELLTDYLRDRYQCVKIGENFSVDILNAPFGVPQGSILGVTLFLIYINDLCDLNLQNGMIVSYADDTALLFTGKTRSEATAYAQSGFNTVSNWLFNNVLTLNTQKTKYIHFSIRNNNTYDSTNNTLLAHNNVCRSPADAACTCPTLEAAPCIKYLGIMLDANLNFRNHIDLLCKRVRKLIFIFKTIRGASNFKLLRQVYLSLCQSIISYCITSWGGASKTILLPLERAQRAILKVATFRRFMFPTYELYQSTNVLTVRQLLILHTTLKQHESLPFKPLPPEKRRKDLVCTKIPAKHAFANRFFLFLGPFLYNRLNKTLDIYNLNYKQCNKVITKHLQTLTYSDTENLLIVVK